MAVLSREQYLEKIQAMVGEDTSDESLKLIEDMTDTYDRNKENDDWRQKYEELDKTWREKYKSRFFSGSETTTTDVQDDTTVLDDTEKPSEETITLEDLFE